MGTWNIARTEIARTGSSPLTRNLSMSDVPTYNENSNIIIRRYKIRR